MQFINRIILVLTAVLLTTWIGVLAHHVSEPRVVGRATAPDGTEMCVVQEFNWGAEPFTTSFVYRKPGGPWGRFYYDHQDDYWAGSRVALDTNAQQAVFFRNGSPAVTFQWAKESYTLHRRNQTMTNAQWRMPDSWSPRQSVYQN